MEEALQCSAHYPGTRSKICAPGRAQISPNQSKFHHISSYFYISSPSMPVLFAYYFHILSQHKKGNILAEVLRGRSRVDETFLRLFALFVFDVQIVFCAGFLLGRVSLRLWRRMVKSRPKALP